MFRGREQAHPERGETLLRKLADELAELGVIEQQPNQEGRNMTMILAPVKVSPNSRRGREPDAATAEAPAAVQPADQASPAAQPAEGNGTPAAEPAPENAAPVE
jgi:translation initiation factor IF-3